MQSVRFITISSKTKCTNSKKHLHNFSRRALKSQRRKIRHKLMKILIRLVLSTTNNQRPSPSPTSISLHKGCFIRKREADEIEFSKRNNIEIQDDDETEEAVRERQIDLQIINVQAPDNKSFQLNIPDNDDLLDIDFSAPKVNPSLALQNPQNISSKTPHISDDLYYFDYIDDSLQKTDPVNQRNLQAFGSKQVKIFENDDFDIMKIDFNKTKQQQNEGESNKPKTKLNIFDTKSFQASKKEMDFIFYDLDPMDFQEEWINFDSQLNY